MKFSKILCGLVCAGVLCTGVAQASAIAESKITVDNLSLTFFDSDVGGNELTPGTASGSDIVLSDVGINFVGTSVSTTLNGVNEGDAFTETPTDPFALIDIDISSSQTSGADLATASSVLDGNILTTGASGITDSNVAVYGTSSGDVNSQIVNNLKSVFAFTVATDVYIELNFDWMLDVFVSIFDEGGTGNATWDLDVTFKESCIGLSGCAASLIGFDLSSAVGQAQTGTLNDVGDIFDEEVRSSFASSRVLLTAGEYALNIVQNTSTAATSVPAPTSLAILGLGLLGVAGISRKNKLRVKN